MIIKIKNAIIFTLEDDINYFFIYAQHYNCKDENKNYFLSKVKSHQNNIYDCVDYKLEAESYDACCTQVLPSYAASTLRCIVMKFRKAVRCINTGKIEASLFETVSIKTTNK
jgi:hypothetical protein